MKEEIIKRSGISRWWWIALGVGLVLVSIFGFPHVADETGKVNMFIACVSVGAFAGGIAVTIFALKKGTQESLLFVKDKARVTKNANTINIFVRKNKRTQAIEPLRIQFARCQPWGQRHKLENDGQFYYVHFNDLETKKMGDIALPDTMYLDPRKYVIPLTMPADESYWKPLPNMWQKLAPWAIVAAIGILAFLYVVTGD